VADFNALKPPPSLSGPYEDYVKAQKRVHTQDLEALNAAQDGDTEAYLAVREQRDSEQPQRHELARQIGFQVCSAAPASG
jgi:hypothetical protein